jgi:hypothetical protein
MSLASLSSAGRASRSDSSRSILDPNKRGRSAGFTTCYHGAGGPEVCPQVTFRSVVMQDGSPWKTLNEVDRSGTRDLVEELPLKSTRPNVGLSPRLSCREISQCLPRLLLDTNVSAFCAPIQPLKC